MQSSETIGKKIDTLFELREYKRTLEAQVKKVSAEMAEREEELLVALDAEGGLSGARGMLASVAVSELVVPQTEDWDRFITFVRRHNKFELLERRVSAPAFRELAAQRRDKTVPGLVPYLKRGISIRKV